MSIQKRAARVGFDWPHTADILEKMDEEVGELREAINDHDKDHIEEEFGDLLFVMANLGRRLELDPEAALRRANEKFTRRFSFIEAELARTARPIEEASLDEMEALWDEAKKREKE